MWHTAFLTAYAPPKARKFIKFERLVSGEKEVPRKQTPQEMVAIALAWTKALKR